jgi:signal peptidase I
LIPGIADVDRGDIVAFRMPRTSPHRCRGGGVSLKRVVGVAGDAVTRRSGGLYVDRTFPAGNAPAERFGSGLVSIPEGHYFVMSDNPRGYCDSREIGPISKAHVLGKVFLVYSAPWNIRWP